MSPNRSLNLRSVVGPLVVLGLLIAAGCDETPGGLEQDDVSLATSAAAADRTLQESENARLPRDIRQWVRHLRREMRQFRAFEAAAPGGYVAQLSPCVESPAGGMGYHYGNPALIDGKLEALKPEILLYEPRPRGRLRFVGVEYVVPFGAWDEPHPPEVEGVELHRNEDLGLWVLHVWTQRRNPTGVFQDFNPRVTCEFAAPPA